MLGKGPKGRRAVSLLLAFDSAERRLHQGTAAVVEIDRTKNRRREG
jgi:hypothetical protein